MAVFRVERTNNYTVMSNYHLRDKNLSLKAKGLLSQMLSLPEDWDYTLAGLARINAEGKDAIRAAVVELEKAGYVQRRQTTDRAEKFGSNEYVIREYPVTHEPPPEGPSSALPLSGNPMTEEPSTVPTQTEKPTQINKDSRKKEKQITDSQSTDSFPFPSSPPVVVTSSTSLASPQAAKLTHSAAAPLPTRTASLGARGDPSGAADPRLTEKNLRDAGFHVRLADGQDIKRILAVYYQQDVVTEQFLNFDGEGSVIGNG